MSIFKDKQEGMPANSEASIRTYLDREGVRIMPTMGPGYPFTSEFKYGPGGVPVESCRRPRRGHDV